MGKLISKLFGKKEMRVLMLGLDGAGKTTILNWLNNQSQDPTIPTVGTSVETITFKNVKFTVWDVGGQVNIRPLWRHFYIGTQALVFVVDSSDRARIAEAKVELHRILSDREMANVLLLIVANKQDFPNVMSPDEIEDQLGLRSLNDRVWFVQPATATKNEGLYEGFSWLVNNYKDE